MKIKYLKPHLDSKAGDEVEVSDTLGAYLVRMNVAEDLGSEKVEKEQPKEKKHITRGAKKKHINKP